MFKLFKYLKKKDYLYIFISIIFIVLQVWLNLAIPDYMKEVIGISTTPGAKLNELFAPGAKMLGLALGSALSAVFVGYLSANIAASYSKSVRHEVYDKVLSFSSHEMNQFSTPSLITRTTNDITQTQMLIATGMQLVIQAPIMAVMAILKILDKGWEWSLATLVAVFILTILIITIILIALPRFKKIQLLTDDLNRVTRENLMGSRIVRAYNAEDYQEDKFKKTNKELMETELFTRRVMSLMSPVMMLVMNGLMLAIYWIGAFLINKSSLAEVGPLYQDLMVFTQYAMQVVMSFIMMTMILFIYPRASVSAKRINEVLDSKTSVKNDPKISLNDIKEKGVIEFKDVCFKYPDAEEYILKDLNFKINKGEVAAFIGSTGSGKSSLVNLVPRFYDASEGEVLINNVNVKDYDLKDLNKIISYVPQKAVLFSMSVKENIAFGEALEKVDDISIKKAIEIAQAKDFVEKMENQYDSHIAQGGTNVSGGQKQRLSIARAIARDPEIIIFDDSFSALDYKTDQILRRKIKEEMSGVTTLIVAQRIGTIIDADQIFVLEEGKIVGSGTHKELLENCKVYQEIAYSQLSEEELK